jgi:hypothetical protein
MSSLPPTRILDAPIFQLLNLMEEADKGSSPTKPGILYLFKALCNNFFNFILSKYILRQSNFTRALKKNNDSRTV